MKFRYCILAWSKNAVDQRDECLSTRKILTFWIITILSWQLKSDFSTWYLVYKFFALKKRENWMCDKVRVGDYQFCENQNMSLIWLRWECGRLFSVRSILDCCALQRRQHQFRDCSYQVSSYLCQASVRIAAVAARPLPSFDRDKCFQYKRTLRTYALRKKAAASVSRVVHLAIPFLIIFLLKSVVRLTNWRTCAYLKLHGVWRLLENVVIRRCLVSWRVF